MNLADVVACWEHPLREVPDRLLVNRDGALMHRSQAIKTFVANDTSHGGV